MIIFPTRTCFDDAAEYIEGLVQDEPWMAHCKTLFLVHAIVTCNQVAGPYSHAWVEHTEKGRVLVWQAGVLADGRRCWYAATLEEFQTEICIQKVTRYTIRQMWEQNRKHGTVGPWEEEYRALCRDYQPKAST